MMTKNSATVEQFMKWVGDAKVMIAINSYEVCEKIMGVEECGQVLQKSLQCMEEELGVEKNALVLKHCGVMVEIEKDTFKIIEE